jgi:hypothetical protein
LKGRNFESESGKSKSRPNKYGMNGENELLVDRRRWR